MSLILLVDDDTDMMKLSANWLKKAGYEVEMASSGKEALSFLQNEKPSLILLDYAMPVLNGPETLIEIQKDPALKEIPVIFRTGKDDESYIDEMKCLDPAGIVSKAEGKKSLLKAVEDVLQ